MDIYCTQCGHKQDSQKRFCSQCGHIMSQVKPRAALQQVEQPSPQPTVQRVEQPSPQPTVQRAQMVNPQPTVQRMEQPAPQPTVQRMDQPAPKPVEKPNVQKQTAAEKKPEKNKKVEKKPKKKIKKPKKDVPGKQKKKSKHGFLIFLCVLAVLALLLLGAWFAFGNQLTLHLHSKDVVATLNSGSLDIPGANSNDVEKLPDYVRQMMGEEAMQGQKMGPLLSAILPYVRVECSKVHGLFGASSIDYSITAPDVEAWLISLDPAGIGSADELMAALQEYLPTAPARTRIVSITYERSGFFSADWEGMYETSTFIDAVSGGVSSGYSVLYQKALEELKEELG